MRILMVHNRRRSAAPSGENLVVDQESAALVAHGHTVEHFERHSDDIARWPLRTKALLPGKVIWNREAQRSLRDTLRASRPDVVHVHNVKPLMSPSVLRACYDERVPVVATLHNYALACPAGTLFRNGSVCRDCIGRPPLPAVWHGCYRRSRSGTLLVALSLVVNRRAWRDLVSAYIFLSQAQRDNLASAGLPRERSFVKWNRIERRSRQPSDPSDAVVYSGRLADDKGVRTLMTAWDRYLADIGHGRLRLVIAGTGPLHASVASWAESRRSVEFVGAVDHDRALQLVSGARAVVVPSAWEEPFGMAAVEAMAAEAPVIASARGALPDLVRDGIDGVLFEPESSEELARRLADADRHPDRFRRYGRAALRSYEERFDPDDNLEQLLHIYRFALQNPVWEHGEIA